MCISIIYWHWFFLIYVEEWYCVNPTNLKSTKIRQNNSNKKRSIGMPFHTADCGLGPAALTARTPTDHLLWPGRAKQWERTHRLDTVLLLRGWAPEEAMLSGKSAWVHQCYASRNRLCADIDEIIWRFLKDAVSSINVTSFQFLLDKYTLNETQGNTPIFAPPILFFIWVLFLARKSNGVKTLREFIRKEDTIGDKICMRKPRNEKRIVILHNHGL